MNYKSLFAKLERNLGRLDERDSTSGTLPAIVERLVEDFRDDLGLLGGRIYAREEDELVLRTEYPRTTARIGFRIPVSYPPVQELLQQGFVLHELGDPGVDREIESALGVRTFAAILVGSHVVAFSLKDSSDHEHAIYLLNTIRHAVNLTLRSERLEDRVAQARSIQMSLLPASPPVFADYDLWGATCPAEEVGGDLYDFIPVSERSLGIAIADSAGHGLPAALQARDAIVGLRMGVEERWRITATIEKLNKVVGRSAAVSRFITLFYCEIEPGGNLVYCNAGHNAPLLLREDTFRELTRGGLVLGPNPGASYERGYERMDPGSILFAYTDGIIEAEDTAGRAFGVRHLKTLIRRSPWSSARALVEAVFEEVRRFSGEGPPRDDQTAVAVLRRAGTETDQPSRKK